MSVNSLKCLDCSLLLKTSGWYLRQSHSVWDQVVAAPEVGALSWPFVAQAWRHLEIPPA